MAEPGVGAPERLVRIRGLSDRGLSRAAESLGRMLGRPVRFADLDIQHGRPSIAAALPGVVGGSLALLWI